MKQCHFRTAMLSALVILCCGAAAIAHPGHETSSAASGFVHPLNGLDHLLAMIAVGVWAAQLGGRARWLVPASFVIAMSLGGALAMLNFSIHFAQHAIISSVLVFGLFIALAARLPIAAASAIVGLFALFHGFAHVAELKSGDSIAGYAAGFVFATAALHIAGSFLGLILQYTNRPQLTRLCGACIAVVAVALWAFAP